MMQGGHQQPEQMARDPQRAPPGRFEPGVEVADAVVRPTVRVAGRVDRKKISEVSAAVRGLIAAGAAELTVDVSGSWDGAGLLPVLAGARAVLAARGGTLGLVGVALPEFLPALTTAPLDQVFLIYDSVRPHPDAGVPAPHSVEAVTAEPDSPVDQLGA